MTIAQWLKQTTARLQNAGIETARLDALVLLEDWLHKNKAQLLARDDEEIPDEQFPRLEVAVQRRTAHEPLAYIRGKSEFYGREFRVDKNVLVPRPESEAMIDLFKILLHEPSAPQNDAKTNRVTVADIGTGSGALAISAKLEVPEILAIAVDIDQKCLEITRQNAARLQAEVETLQGDLLEPLYDKDAKHGLVLLCNLPYVPDGYVVNQAARHEPELALFAGKDGLDLYRKLFNQLPQLTTQPQYILTEALPFQHEPLQAIAAAHGYHQNGGQDLIQSFAAA